MTLNVIEVLKESIFNLKDYKPDKVINEDGYQTGYYYIIPSKSKQNFIFHISHGKLKIVALDTLDVVCEIIRKDGLYTVYINKYNVPITLIINSFRVIEVTSN